LVKINKKVLKSATACLLVGAIAALSSGASPAKASLNSSWVPVLIAGGGQLGSGLEGELAACAEAPGCGNSQAGRILRPVGMAIHPVTGDFYFSQ
jgi:hypothetical protein